MEDCSKIERLTSIRFDQDYIQVNQIFANKTLEAIQLSRDEEPDIEPLVWIHDYHLTLTPSIIRQVMSLPRRSFQISYYCSLILQ